MFHTPAHKQTSSRNSKDITLNDYIQRKYPQELPKDLPEPSFGFLVVDHNTGQWCESDKGNPAFDSVQMQEYVKIKNDQLKEVLLKARNLLSHPTSWWTTEPTLSRRQEVSVEITKILDSLF